MIEVIHARGHINVLSTHGNTLEVTKETHLTPRGDCIIAVNSDKAMNELSREFKNKLMNDDTILEITIECNGVKDTVIAYGSSKLSLTHPTDLVVRKSNFTCSRTLAVRADKAAVDIDRKLIRELQKDQDVKVTLKLK